MLIIALFIQVWGNMVGGTKIKIKHECLVYSLMRRLGVIYGSIKII